MTTLAFPKEVPTATFPALKEAELCRRKACARVIRDQKRYGHLMGQPSEWCVVTENGLAKPSFHARYERDLLRDRLERGHRVVLTLGIIAESRVSLTPDNHVAEVKVEDPCNVPSDQLTELTEQAKVHALSGPVA